MKTALYTLSGHIGARTAEVSCKRKPLKAECFDVPGSNRSLSRYSCGREQFNLVRESLPVPGVLSHKKYFVRQKAQFAHEEEHESVRDVLLNLLMLS